MNEWGRLGNVAEHSLRELWDGAMARRLRAAMLRDDLTLGCEQCALAAEEGGRSSAFAVVYDQLGPAALERAWPLQLELALSNACNLQCTMCNGELSSAIRLHREHRPALAPVYDDAFFAELDDFLPHLRSVVLLGGEPFLGAETLRVLHRLVELGLRPHCSVTTNGTIWTPRVEALVAALPMHLTFSVDAATPETFASIRVGADLHQVRANLDRARRALAEHGGSCSVAFCLLRDNWHELGAVLSWADELDLDVFVNQVAHPPAQSLVHAPLGELEAIVTGLEHEHRHRRDQLGRNRAVWDQQLELVRGVLQGRHHAPPPADIVPVPVAIGRSVVEAGPDQLVRSVDDAGAARLGVDLASLVGRPLWHVVRLVGDALGDLASSSVQRLPSGGEQRVVRFDGTGGPVTLVAELETAADGSQAWHLAFDEEPS